MSQIIDFLKITCGSCKFMQLSFFANIFVRTVLTDRSTNPILLKIDIHVRFIMMHV